MAAAAVTVEDNPLAVRDATRAAAGRAGEGGGVKEGPPAAWGRARDRAWPNNATRLAPSSALPPLRPPTGVPGTDTACDAAEADEPVMYCAGGGAASVRKTSDGSCKPGGNRPPVAHCCCDEPPPTRGLARATGDAPDATIDLRACSSASVPTNRRKASGSAYADDEEAEAEDAVEDDDDAETADTDATAEDAAWADAR